MRMVPDPAPARDALTSPLDALLAATDLTRGDEPAELRALLGAAAAAVGADAVALHRVDPRTGRLALVGAVGMEDDGCDGPAPDGLAARVLEHGEEVAGRADGLPPDLRARGLAYALGMPVVARDHPVGVLCLVARRPLDDDPVRRHAARVCAARCGWFLERGHLYESLERAMAQILETDERMLGRIGLDIHDGPTQQLSVALLEVQLLEAELSDAEAAGEVLPDKLRPALGRIYETLGGALHEMRELIGHLRPAHFENRTLPDVLEDAVRAFEVRADAEATFVVEGDAQDEDGITLSQRITFYRILQEALTNVYRHAGVKSVRVRLLAQGPAVRLEVLDRGRGFTPPPLVGPQATERAEHIGLRGMRERVALVGGTLTLESAPGHGTRIVVEVPADE